MNIDDLLLQRDLTGVDLSGSSLGGLDLCGKNLRGADLSNAHLGGALLRGADLRNANLFRANLGAADLTGSDLRYSDLREANLGGANLTGADTRECLGIDHQFRQQTCPPYLLKHFEWEESPDFKSAVNDGFQPLMHWGRAYKLEPSEITLYRSPTAWRSIKTQLGGLIFGDKHTYKQVRLVQQYRHYSQWAYMITREGFEGIAQRLGIKLHPKSDGSE